MKIISRQFNNSFFQAHLTHVPWTLRFYIVKKFLLLTFWMTLALCLLINLFDLIDLFRKSAGHPQAHFWIPLEISALHIPFYFLSILPFGILLGGVSSFFFLARASELTAARAASISAWQFLTGPLTATFFLGVFAVLAISPLSAKCYRSAALFEENYLQTPLVGEQAELWLKEADNGLKPNGHLILHLYNLSRKDFSDKNALLAADRATILRLDEKENFLRRLETQKVRLEKGKWLFENTTEIIPGRKPQKLGNYSLPTHLTAQRAKKIGLSADTLSIWNLPRTIHWRQKSGLPVRRQQLHLYTLLALPVLNVTMLLIAAGFTLRPFPQGQRKTITVIGIGIGTGFCLFALSKIAEQLGNSGSMPPFFAAFLPVLTGICLAGSLLLKIEEG